MSQPTDATSHLTVVEPGDEVKPPHQVRRDIADCLTGVAKFARQGSGYRRGDVTYAPIRAAVLVVFDADGEPSPIAIGFDAVDPSERGRLLHQASDALALVLRVPWATQAFRLNRLAQMWKNETGTEATSFLQLVRQSWLRDETNRAKAQERAAAKHAALEQERPFLCRCGFRAKTQGGLTNHQNRSRVHRSER